MILGRSVLSAPGYGGSRHGGKLDTGILMNEGGIAGMLYQGDIATLFLDYVYFFGGAASWLTRGYSS